MNPENQVVSVPQPRYNGDKISFLPGTVDTDYLQWTRAITKVIEEYRWEKRDKRSAIEAEKEKNILATDHTWAEKLKLYGPKPTEEQIKENTDGRVGEHKESLKNYHKRIRDEAGWRWADLASRIETEVPGLQLTQRNIADGELAVFTKDGHTIYTVLVGPARFGATDTDRGFGNNVYTKRGYQDYYYRTSKMFVHDANTVMTRRYVTRAVTIFGLANMCGWAIIPPDQVYDGQDAGLPERLQRKVDNVELMAKLVKAESDAQVPRYTKPGFGGHAAVFDITHAAVLYEPTREIPAPYHAASDVHPHGPATQLVLQNVECPNNRADVMTDNERASMQVRNGSGSNQPFLSTASIQTSDKVIRANKGERFDTGAENQATLEVDLSLARQDGVIIVNQHTEESNAFKIAFDRYLTNDDITAMERTLYRWIATRKNDVSGAGQNELATIAGADWSTLKDKTVEELAVAMAGKLKPAQVGLSAADLKGLSEPAVAKLMRLQGDTINRSEMTARRPAKDELDEYIYSARKNREVLMNHIPLRCITAIRFNVESDKWGDLTVTEIASRYPNLAEALRNPHQWYSFLKIQDDLRGYLTEDGGRRLLQMHNKAARDKKAETGRT
jgi:hypothetical protein